MAAYEYELVLSREAAGRLFELAEARRPAFLPVSFIQGKRKHRVCVWQVAPSPPSNRQRWIEIPSPRDFLASFDVIKVFSDRGFRIIRGRARLEQGYRARFQRVLDTYGADPLPGLTAIVVGLGRLGSKVAQALVEQGIRSLILIDPQTVEEPNRQLLPYSRAPVGSPKVEALKSQLQGYGLEVSTIQKAIWDLDKGDGEWQALADGDVLFLCTDNALARATACCWALRVGIPVFEGGIHIDTDGDPTPRPDRPPRLFGRVQTAIPSHWCLFCLPEGLDREAAAQELAEVERRGRLPAEPRPADPTLSGLVASAMVLIFRRALHGGGLAPRYVFELTGEGGGLSARREVPEIRAQCPHCRPFPAPVDDRPTIQDVRRRGRRRAATLGRALSRAFERAVLGIGAALGAGLGGAFALGLAVALLLLTRHLIGFWEFCNWRECYGTPNPFHFLWYFWDEYEYDHHVGHFFGLLLSAAHFLLLPYWLVGLPILTARWGYAAFGIPFVRRRARRALRRAFQGLEELRDRWPAAPQLRIPLWMQRLLQRIAQGLGVVTEAAAVALLFAALKGLGATFWLITTASFLLPLWVAVGIGYGAIHNLRGIAAFIEGLCRGRWDSSLSLRRRRRRRR